MAESAAALAVESPFKIDKAGDPMVAGDTVMCDALKSKDNHDKKKAKVEPVSQNF